MTLPDCCDYDTAAAWKAVQSVFYLLKVHSAHEHHVKQHGAYAHEKETYLHNCFCRKFVIFFKSTIGLNILYHEKCWRNRLEINVSLIWMWFIGSNWKNGTWRTTVCFVRQIAWSVGATAVNTRASDKAYKFYISLESSLAPRISWPWQGGGGLDAAI